MGPVSDANENYPSAWRALVLVSLIGVAMTSISATGAETMQKTMPKTSELSVKRLPNNPIITPSLSASIGTNINGPSLIKVPAWVKNPLGRYYLYFSHHKGQSIRLAYADQLAGPWSIFDEGALSLADSGFPTAIDESALPAPVQARIKATGRPLDDLIYAHIASPEAIVVDDKQEIRLYYHGMLPDSTQMSRVAVSRDGIHFTAMPDVITRSYLRVFPFRGKFYGLAMPGQLYRSADGLTGFEEGPRLFNSNMRHSALLLRGDTLYVFWTQVGDIPERILLSRIELAGDWNRWRETEPVEVLRPERPWEGAGLPLVASVRGAIEEPVNQLRDPEIFEEDGRTWLLYSVSGESGIAIAEMRFDTHH